MSYLGNNPELQQYTLTIDKFNGDDACTEFTLSRSIDDPVAVEVLVNSVQQTPVDAYSLSAGVITFTEAPSTGSNNIVVIHRSTSVYTQVQVGSKDIQDGAVTTTKILDDSVTTAKVANNAITADKLAAEVSSNILSDTGVEAGTYGGQSNVSVITVDTSGRLTSAANVAIFIPTQYETVNAMPTMLMLSGM